MRYNQVAIFLVDWPFCVVDMSPPQPRDGL
jgi:hypothetical protein